MVILNVILNSYNVRGLAHKTGIAKGKVSQMW